MSEVKCGYCGAPGAHPGTKKCSDATMCELNCSRAEAAMLRAKLTSLPDDAEITEREWCDGNGNLGPCMCADGPTIKGHWRIKKKLTGAEWKAALSSTSDSWLREHDRALLEKAWDVAWDALLDEHGWRGHKEGLRQRFIKEVLGE